MANANHAGVALRDYGDATDLIGPQRTAADFVLLLKQQPSEAAARFRTVAWTLVRLDAQSHTPDLSPPVRDELQEAWAVVLWLADFLHDNEERLRRVH